MFVGYRRLSRKRCEIGQWLPWNVNRKSWVSDWMVYISMTLSDPQPGFQGHCILPSRISQNGSFRDKVTKNTNRKPHTIYRMVPLSMTLSDLWPRFQRRDIFLTLNISNDTRYSQSYYRTSIGSHMHSVERWHFQWPLRTPNPVFKVTVFLKSYISKTVRFRDKVTEEH